jgi:hypothetical protein
MYNRQALGTGLVTQKVIMTRERQKHFDAQGEVKVVSQNEWKVRDSYLNVRSEIYDMLIDSMAEGNLTATQALKAAKKFAFHYFKVTWYLEDEAKALKEKAKKEGKEPPITVTSCPVIQICAKDDGGMHFMVRKRLVKPS